MSKKEKQAGADEAKVQNSEENKRSQEESET